jgi:Tfp pilus assembly protein PilF
MAAKEWARWEAAMDFRLDLATDAVEPSIRLSTVGTTVPAIVGSAIVSRESLARRGRCVFFSLFWVALALPYATGCSSVTSPSKWRWPWQSAAAPAPPNPFVANASKPASGAFGGQQAAFAAAATEWPDEKRAARDLKLALAQMLEQQGAAAEAVEAYENVLRSEPNHTAVAHRLAVLLDKTGQSRRAEPYYQACLRAAPNDPDLLSDFAYHCYLERRWAEAESHLQRALAVAPRHARARNNLGLVLARTERPREAFDQFNGGGCSPADAHANVAFALAAEARFDDAERVYQIALQTDPNHPRAREGLAALRQARQVAAAPRSAVPGHSLPAQNAPVLR